MVLDDASPQAYGFQDENVSSDTFDRPTDRSSPFAKYYPLQVRQELIRQPGFFGMYLTFFGKRNWEHRFNEDLINRIENTKLVIQRYPTQEELDCFTEQTSRGIYQARVGLPIGFAAGIIHSLYQIRTATDAPRGFNPAETLKYIRTHAKADPSWFRQAAFLAGFKLFAWSITGVTLSSIYASYKATTNMLMDPRLEKLREEIRNQKPEDIQKRKMDRANERYQQVQRAREASKQGAFAEGQEQGANEGRVSGEQPNTYYGTGTTDVRESIPTPSQPERRIYGNRATTSSSTGGSDFFDDASPTNPNYGTDDSSSSSAVGGSAWERIRQQNISGGGAEQRRSPSQGYRAPQQPNQPSSESYESEERNRLREREQAQRDFDRMLEAERKSGDDVSGTGGQNRGWGSWK
jgi:hypothetical protein